MGVPLPPPPHTPIDPPELIDGREVNNVYNACHSSYIKILANLYILKTIFSETTNILQAGSADSEIKMAKETNYQYNQTHILFFLVTSCQPIQDRVNNCA